jgi:teichuronic acid biosynthesis glycosyltransferase TuaC
MTATAARAEAGADLGRALRALVVTNIYPTPAAPDDGTFVADQVASLRDAGVAIELLHLPRTIGGRGVYRGLGGRVESIVRTMDPDVVHVMYGGVMADIVSKSVRTPVVVSFCGTDLLGGEGRGVLHGLSRRYGVIASRRAAARAAGVVVKSRNLFDALPRDVDRSRVWIVPNGVDLERFRPRDRRECQVDIGWEPGRKHVLFPASPVRPEKRFSLAERSVERVRAGGVDAELHVLAGVPHDDVPAWLNASDAVLLTSVHEGSPNVVKEALACNVPVVSVDVGDVRERIAGVEGCHVSEPTPQDLADSLERVFAGERPTGGRERVADVSLARIAAQLREIYATLAGSGS